MARPGYIDAADDMLLDFDRLDRENRGKLTPSVIDSVIHMAEMSLPADWISTQLELDPGDVVRVLQDGGYKPK